MAYLRYAPDIETPAPDEQKSIDGIIQGMTQQSQVVEKREHRAVRASHAKSSACVVGELVVPENLPRNSHRACSPNRGRTRWRCASRKGLGDPGRPGVDPPRHVDQGLRGARREAAGPRCRDPRLRARHRHDLPSGTAAGFLRDGTVIGKSTACQRGVKSAVAATARNLNRVLHAFGTESAMADFLGHPYSHPLADSYFSQAPMRFGDYVAKLGAVPASQAQLDLAEWRLDPHGDEDGFRSRGAGVSSASPTWSTS